MANPEFNPGPGENLDQDEEKGSELSRAIEEVRESLDRFNEEEATEEEKKGLAEKFRKAHQALGIEEAKEDIKRRAEESTKEFL
jgi:hypothetical protein